MKSLSLKKFYLLLTFLSLTAFITTPAFGGKPVDNDKDTFASSVDCNDNNASVYPNAPEICDGIDNQCPGNTGFGTIDEGCGGGSDINHGNLKMSEYPGNCHSCHSTEYNHFAQSVHYKWQGPAEDDMNVNGEVRGKIGNVVNNFCVNILGNWPVCGKCHAGRGLRPDDPSADWSNFDCLMCHNTEYNQARTRIGSGAGSMTVANPTDTMVQNIEMPTVTVCGKCHFEAAGADGIKRGDFSNAIKTNTNPNIDVHMNTAGPDVQCTDCHEFFEHKVSGKGSDIDPVDGAAEVSCSTTTCHPGFNTGGGHAAAGAIRSEGDRHIHRVSCQACHIDYFAKSAPTEMDRNFSIKLHTGVDATTCDAANPCPGHPERTDLSNVVPTFKFWNRLTNNMRLGENASPWWNNEEQLYDTVILEGDVNNGKLYPFKRKLSQAWTHNNSGAIIALDSYEYLVGPTGNITTSLEKGMVNMGFNSTDSYTETKSGTYMMINHGVAPAATVSCAKCHSSGNLDLTNDSMLDKLGYKLKGPKSQICSQCHFEKNLPRTHERIHNHITKTAGGSVGIDCLFCHSFTRPERGLVSPCSPAASNYVDTNPYPHTECQ